MKYMNISLHNNLSILANNYKCILPTNSNLSFLHSLLTHHNNHHHHRRRQHRRHHRHHHHHHHHHHRHSHDHRIVR
uniref:Uncharacterized protein n=1 Tax=Glossina pallidipes TaxID=7398 RepID=A0A1A9Z0C3_GLOPL